MIYKTRSFWLLAYLVWISYKCTRGTTEPPLSTYIDSAVGFRKHTLKRHLSFSHSLAPTLANFPIPHTSPRIDYLSEANNTLSRLPRRLSVLLLSIRFLSGRYRTIHWVKTFIFADRSTSRITAHRKALSPSSSARPSTESNMSNQFIGLTMLVTLSSPAGAQLRGVVSGIEPGKTLTLRNGKL